MLFQIDDFQQQLAEVENKLGQRTQEVEVMQNELKLVKEFRRKRAQMQKELEEVKSPFKQASYCIDNAHIKWLIIIQIYLIVLNLNILLL